MSVLIVNPEFPLLNILHMSGKRREVLPAENVYIFVGPKLLSLSFEASYIDQLADIFHHCY